MDARRRSPAHGGSSPQHSHGRAGYNRALDDATEQQGPPPPPRADLQPRRGPQRATHSSNDDAPATPAAPRPESSQLHHSQKRRGRDTGGARVSALILCNLARSAEGHPAGEVRTRSAASTRNAADLAQSCPPRHPNPTSREGPTGPTLRANPCPEVTDQDCRFPLPTLIYRLEAANLGDRMRRLVRSVSKQV